MFPAIVSKGDLEHTVLHRWCCVIYLLVKITSLYVYIWIYDLLYIDMMGTHRHYLS